VNFSPLGLESGRVEQLSSVAFRYSERLSVLFMDFYREMIAPLFFEGRDLPQRVTLRKGAIIDGTLNAAEEWANALNRLTRRSDLRRCTLRPWRDVLAPRGLARESRAWCPLCLEEMRVGGSHGDSLVYEPLVWRFREVEVCPNHRVRQATTCPACGRGRQHTFSATARVGCCRYCGAWMGRAQVAAADLEVTEMEVFCARFCEQMLELSSTVDESQILRSDLAVQALRDVFFAGRGSVMAKAIGHDTRPVNKYADGLIPAPLNLFLRVAWVTGTTPEQIFVTNRFECDVTPREAEFDPYRVRRTRTLGDNELRRELEFALAETPGTSVRAIALRLGRAPAVVWRREPELASRLSRAHAAYVAQESQRKKDAFEQTVRSLVDEFRTQGKRPSMDEMKGLLNDNGCLLDPWKRRVISRSLCEAFSVNTVSV
jgi:hypothetical protein